MLAEISHLPSPEIKEALLKAHFDWRKDEEQVDDILVIGIRVWIAIEKIVLILIILKNFTSSLMEPLRGSDCCCSLAG
jgi:hypothetical protein